MIAAVPERNSIVTLYCDVENLLIFLNFVEIKSITFFGPVKTTIYKYKMVRIYNFLSFGTK